MRNVKSKCKSPTNIYFENELAHWRATKPADLKRKHAWVETEDGRPLRVNGKGEAKIGPYDCPLPVLDALELSHLCRDDVELTVGRMYPAGPGYDSRVHVCYSERTIEEIFTYYATA